MSCDIQSQSRCVQCVGCIDIDIHKVQTLERSRGCAEQRSSHTLDSVAITANSLRVTLDWSPRLACHIDICNKEDILIQSCSLLGKCLQRCNILHHEDIVGCCVDNRVRELTNVSCNQWFGLVGLDGCIHHATLLVVQSYIKLVVNASRNYCVDVGWLLAELNTLAKRVLDNLLRCCGCSSLALLKIEIESTCDSLAVGIRNLSQNNLR